MELFNFLSTLVSVAFGAALAAGWEAWKSSRADRQTRASVRTLLAQEVAHNVEFLTTVRDKYKAEQKLVEETSKRDSMGGVAHEGNPIHYLKNTQFDLISLDAWTSQMSVLHLALNSDEMAGMYEFYGHVRSAKAAFERFQDYKPTNTGLLLVVWGQLASGVIDEVEEALDAAPRLDVK